MLAGKTLLNYANLFSSYDYTKHNKIIDKYFKDKYGKPRAKKIDEIRNGPLKEINHNDLISEKLKKTCKYLNYVEHLLI